MSELTVSFVAEDGRKLQATEAVSFSVGSNECVVILGESGSGKTVTARSIMGLLGPNALIEAGSIVFRGADLIENPLALDEIRGRSVAMVFQDALSALNPVKTVGSQIAEMFRVHEGRGRREAAEAAISLMAELQIPDPADRYHSFPHEMSGGMRQRAMLAIAVSLGPELLIADEPTTALDVTVQAATIELLNTMVENRGMALLFITHDVGVAAELADTIVVMYAGSVVEIGQSEQVLESPNHPYTQGLIASVPSKRTVANRISLPGRLPDPYNLPDGCKFAARCPAVQPECLAARPLLREVEDRLVACLRAEELNAS